MATTFNSNSGIHQLPPNCYPPSESDDEDSFVVLNNSLGPDVNFDRAHLNTEPISTLSIQTSLDNIADILAQQTTSVTQNIETGNHIMMDTSHTNCQSSEISADEIQKKVDNLISENLKLKETLAQNNIAMKKQVETIIQWQEEVQRVQESHKEKFADMKKYINTLKAENDQLRDSIKNLESCSAENESKKTKEILVKQTENLKQFELEVAQKKMKELEKALDILSLEKEALGKELASKEQDLNNAIADKDLLKYQLDLSKQKEAKQNDVSSEIIQALKDEIVELRDTNNNLTDKILSLQSQNEKFKADIADREEKLSSAKISIVNLEQDLSQTKQQLMASQMHITELKESHVKILSGSDKKIEELQHHIQDLQINVDENTALRTQLDLYKNDFEMERAQRKEIFTEKNKIADDLQQLQRRNHQLLEEIDQLRSGFVPVRKEEVRAAPTESPPRQIHICPICSSRFGSVRLLEDHVDYCLANTNN